MKISFASLAVAECKKILCPEYSGRVWHVLSVPVNCEGNVGRQLRGQQIPCYYPRIRTGEQSWLSERSKAFFPGVLFAALNEEDKQKLSRIHFIEKIKENRSSRQAATVDADIEFMVLAERLNCFYSFKAVREIPLPPAGGIPGRDFIEFRNENKCGYILLLPKNDIDQVFFGFDSIKRKICFELQKNLFLQILNLK